MQVITFIGNCQTTPLSDFFKSDPHLSSSFKVAMIPPVHTINCLDHKWREVVASSDIIVTQPILNEERFGYLATSLLRDSTISQGKVVLTIPSMYFTGYHPTLDSIPGLKGPLRDNHDFLMLNCFLNGIEEAQAYSLLMDKSFGGNLWRDKALESLVALKSREKEFSVDVKVADYIAKNYQAECLFNTFNHPTKSLFLFVIEALLKRLDVDLSKVEISKVLGIEHTIGPVYPFVSDSLDLRFSSPEPESEGQTFDLHCLINRFFSFYSRCDLNVLKEWSMKKKRFLSDFF